MAEMTHSGFEDRCIISCGMLHPEIAHLMGTGFLKSAPAPFYTAGFTRHFGTVGEDPSQKTNTGSGMVLRPRNYRRVWK